MKSRLEFLGSGDGGHDHGKQPNNLSQASCCSTQRLVVFLAMKSTWCSYWKCMINPARPTA